MTKQWRQALSNSPSRPLTLPPPQQEHEDWAEYEFGQIDFVDGRLRGRLLTMARDFYAQPLAPITQACGGDSAKTKAAYRFLSNRNVDLDTTLLAPHIEAIEWLLLTTVPVEDFAQACERLSWYAVRWGIEVFHRTLKSDTRIEDRCLADAGNLQACLALDMVVAWRVLYLTHLGRKTPDLPCSAFFEEEEWKALWTFHHKDATPPDEPPALGIAMRMVAQIGGFLGRKGGGDPGATVLWRGLDKLAFITDTFRIFHPALPSGP